MSASVGHRRRRSARAATSSAAERLAADGRTSSRARSSTSPTTRPWRDVLAELRPGTRLQLCRVPQRGRLRARGGQRLRGERAWRSSGWPSAAAATPGAKLGPLQHQLRLRRHGRARRTPRRTSPNPQSAYADLEARRRVRRRWPTRRRARGADRRPVRPPTAASPRAATSSSECSRALATRDG